MSLALVTGGTGFVGSHVVRRLLREGISVRCLSRPTSDLRNLEGLPVERVQGDLNDPVSLQKAVQGCQMLFHVAADYRLWVKDPAEMIRTNVEGSRALLTAAAEAGLEKIVYTSSVAAVGRHRRQGELQAGHEGIDPPPDQQIGPYKQSKFASELVAREFAARGVPVIIVNPSTPIGSHDIKPTPTGKMIVDLLNRRMPAYLETGMNFVDVEDVAEGHWLAAQKGKVGERYILGNENMRLADFFARVARLAKCRAPAFRIPYAVAWLAGAVTTGLSSITGKEPAVPLDAVRMAHHTMYYDASKAVKELGLPQTPVDQAIEKAVRWFRENKYAK